MGSGVIASSAEATLDALIDPVLVCGPDRVLHYANGAASALLGEPPTALYGRAVESIVPEHLRVVDGLPFFDWLLQKQRPHGVRAPIRRRDGVEIHQVVRVSVADGNDGGRALIVVLRNAAEGFDREGDPLAQEAREPAPESIYQAVFDAVPVGVLHFDARGRITACNDVFVAQIGSSRQVLVGLDMSTLPNAGVREAVAEALAGRAGHFEGEYVSATGNRRRLHRALFSPILRDGRVEGGVGIVDDITERKQIEARLAQGERMASLGRLAAGVAHEINNPLAYVRTSLDLARREAARLASAGMRTERLEELLAHADDGVERVRVIVHDLKTFSRGDDGSWLPVDLHHVVEIAVNLAWNEIRHRAELHRELAPVPPVMGSESRFAQVLVNLLINAAHAIPEGDAAHNRITVRTGRVDERRVFLEVEDTGTGIEPALLPHVFEPFWTSKPKGVGTGLGLSICHGIVASAGGDIRVARSVPGQGTTFRVELPAGPERDRGRPPSLPSGKARTNPVPRARVLVIDDERKLATTLRLAFKDRFDVVIADNGRDALQTLERDSAFDLVLCDLMMPEVSGIDVYEQVRRSYPRLATRFVFMTGGAFTERARDFLKQHRLRRIEKPFSLEQVEELLAERDP